MKFRKHRLGKDGHGRRRLRPRQARIALIKRKLNNFASQIARSKDGTNKVMRGIMRAIIPDAPYRNPPEIKQVNNLPPPCTALTDNPNTVLPELVPSMNQVIMYATNKSYM